MIRLIRAAFRAICLVVGAVSAMVIALAAAMLVLDRGGQHTAAILVLVIAWVALVFTAWSDGKLKPWSF